MIVPFEYEMTAAHAREMTACAEMVKTDLGWHRENLDTRTTAAAYYGDYFGCTPGREFARATESIYRERHLRILDVGAGRGETSLYLADHGHMVFPVEPSYDFCQIIDYMGQKFGKNLTIYQSSAEHLNLAAEQFDIVIFNASLHHCDDPLLALKNMYRLLLPGGQLLVIGEPILPFFRNGSKVVEEMARLPEVYGDYGGNEHVYHFGEYVSMLEQAGFREVKKEVAERYRSKDVIAKSVADFPHWGGARSVVKNLYLNSIYLLIRFRLKAMLEILKRLSLVQVTFSAVK